MTARLTREENPYYRAYLRHAIINTIVFAVVSGGIFLLAYLGVNAIVDAGLNGAITHDAATFGIGANMACALILVEVAHRVLSC